MGQVPAVVDRHGQVRRMRRFMQALMLAWTAIVALSLVFTVDRHRKAFYAEVYAQAKGIHAMDSEYRNWVISHGGVYVQADSGTPPSPYLSHVPERDIVTPSGRVLTLLNSSYMTRQVHELMDRNNEPIRGHISSLKPINPINRADPWETAALKAFELGRREMSGLTTGADGKSVFRYMKPMVVEPSCLKCHAQQGYKVGDIRGGISVSIPVDRPLGLENKETLALLTGHGLIWVMGVVGLYVGGRRQEAAARLVERSETEVRLLANAIAHAIYGLDLQGRCTFANSACVQMLGYEREEDLLGRDMHALVHHTHADGSPYPFEECPTYRTLREGKEFYIAEDVLWRKDGSSFPVAYWSYPVMQDGACRGVVSTFLDITRQKETDDELKRSRKLLDSIVEHIPAMVFLKRAGDLRFELFNRAGEQLLGYARQDLLGKNDYDFFSKEQADFFTEKDRAVLASHEVIEVPEEPIKTADGSEKWLQTFKIGLYDEQDRPAHLLGISVDITERKRAERELLKIQANLTEAQRIALLGSWELDLVNNTLYWSDEIYRMFEIDQDAFGATYQAFLDAIHPDDRAMVDKAYTDSLRDRTPYAIEHRLRMNDGRIKYVSERCETSFDADGRPLCSRGTVQDITERKQADIALDHANRALLALSTVNRELVHATDESELLHSTCRAIVEQKHYRMAWVGYVGHDAARSIRHMASAGDDYGLLAQVQPNWAEGEDGMGPTGRAVRTGQAQLTMDIGQDPLYPPWKAELVDRGYVASIALPLKENGGVFGVLHVYADEVGAFTEREVDLLEEMAGDLAFGVQSLRIRQERDEAMRLNEEHLARMHETLEQTVIAISRAVEARDPYTAGHQRRVAELACAIGREMGLDEGRLEGIRMGAAIHDIGKIQVPAEMLTKPTRLTDLEYQFIQGHPGIGYEILKDINFPWPVAEIAHQHHERLDGSGYPQGLRGEQICLEAKIVAVADVVEAMSSHRPYRASLGVGAALAEIERGRGGLYDPQVADICLRLLREGKVTMG